MNRSQSHTCRAAADAHAQGVRLALEGKAAEALPFLSEALRDEETSERWNDWATCQIICEQWSEAETGYRRAIDIDPRNTEALANLAVLLVNQKRHQEAILFLDRALALPEAKQLQALQDLLALCKKACGTVPEPPAGNDRARASRPLAPSGPLRILVVHETLPQTDSGGADVRLMQILRVLAAQGHDVTFVARLGMKPDRYIPPLKALGIDVYATDAGRLKFMGADFTSDWSIEQVLQAGRFDLAILCEWFWTGTSIPEHYLPTIRRISPDTRIAILSDDRHGLRELRMAELTKLFTDIERGHDFQDRETELYRKADIVLAITEEDRAGFLEITPDLQTELLPMIAEPGQQGPGLEKRKHLLFLGSFSNLANQDGLEWYFSRVWPLIHAKLPEAQMHLAGSSMPEKLRAMNDGVVGLGRVDDLAAAFAKHRVFISPVRYGTGIKTKNLSALSHGIPIVTTTVGAEGMNLQNGKTALIADDEEEFAAAVVRLYRNGRLWNNLAQGGRAHILQQFSAERLTAQTARFIDRVRSIEPKRFDPGHVPSYQLVEQFFPEVLTHQPSKERPRLRLVAYVHLAEQLLARGEFAEARAQFRHAFHYIRGGIPRLSIFARVLEGLERCYRELGDSESAALCARHKFESPKKPDAPVLQTENRAAIPESQSATGFDEAPLVEALP